MQKFIYSDYLRLLAENDLRAVRTVILSGLPGSGKSTLGEVLQDGFGFDYLSSDVIRVKLMKLVKGKYATTDEYIKNKNNVYDFMREKARRMLNKGRRVVLDATHLNEQLQITTDFLRQLGISGPEGLVVFVDGGSKSNIKKRFELREGVNADGRKWVEAWETAYDFFVSQIKSQVVRIPENYVGKYKVLWVKNY